MIQPSKTTVWLFAMGIMLSMIGCGSLLVPEEWKASFTSLSEIETTNGTVVEANVKEVSQLRRLDYFECQATVIYSVEGKWYRTSRLPLRVKAKQFSNKKNAEAYCTEKYTEQDTVDVFNSRNSPSLASVGEPDVGDWGVMVGMLAMLPVGIVLIGLGLRRHKRERAQAGNAA